MKLITKILRFVFIFLTIWKFNQTNTFFLLEKDIGMIYESSFIYELKVFPNCRFAKFSFDMLNFPLKIRVITLQLHHSGILEDLRITSFVVVR